MTIHSPNFNLKASVTLLAVLALSSGLSCAVVPEAASEPVVVPEPMVVDKTSAAIKDAYASYERRDFAAAAAGYSAVIASGDGDTEDQLLANLGKALVYLSTDSEWRDVAEAGNALQAAEAIQSDSQGVESGMLMNALSALIGSEANISELNSKVANSAAETRKVQNELDAAIVEQDALNEALEKLKALTIGN